jgi:hypothetical protein
MKIGLALSMAVLMSGVGTTASVAHGSLSDWDY